MREFIGLVTNKSIWAIILLVISIWSAFSFYDAGYEKAEARGNEIISEQNKEIVKLRNMLSIDNNIPIRLLLIQCRSLHP
mgnify:FL=1